MAEKLLVYLHTRSDEVQWAITAHSDGSVIDDGVGTLSTLVKLAKGRQVVALLPTDEVFLCEATVPTKNINKARLAVPSQLEDVVSEDIDLLHFALAKSQEDGAYPVGVIAKQRLNLYLSLFQRAGLKVDVMLPSVLAFPMKMHCWGCMHEGQNDVVRTAAYSGFVCEPDLLPLYLDKSKQNDEENLSLVLYLESDEAPSLDDAWSVARSTYRNPMWVFAEGLKDGIPLNLLQGEFQPVRAQSALLKNWLRTLILLGVGAVLWFGYTVYDGFRLKNENQRMEADIERLYKKTFPGSRMVDSSRLKREVENKLNTMRGSGSSTDYLQKAHDILSIVQSMGMTLEKINYRKNQFDMDVSATNLSIFDQLKTALLKQGFDAELISTNNKNGRTFAKMRVK